LRKEGIGKGLVRKGYPAWEKKIRRLALIRPRGKFGSQINYGVRQLLAMNPDSPLRISKRKEN
jgi:hypothetical protein